MLSHIKEIADQVGKEVTLKGWVANKRSGKDIVFVVLRDGSGFLQCVVSQEAVGDQGFEDAKSLTLESSISITGNVVADEKQMGGFELQATSLEIYQIADEYPIAKKEHGVDFLMDHRHLWLRTRRQWAVMHIRNRLIFAIHSYFQKEGFLQMDAPIFTGNAVEGTSTLFETDFYGQPGYLSQSGQLYGEALAMAMGKIYTFGPTFRAEKSKTRRHLSEFWMIEPEIAFCDNEANMDLIEDFMKYIIADALENCKEYLEILERDTSKLEASTTGSYPRLSYDEAVEVLHGNQEVDGKNALVVLEDDLQASKARLAEVIEDIKEREEKIAAGGMKKGEVNFNQQKIAQLSAEQKDLEEEQRNLPNWIESARNFEYGSDFGGSDETILTRLYDTPIMVYNWPKEIKAFYMKETDDGKFAKGVDVLAPEGFGEIVGGGERETDKEVLIDKINEHKLPMEAFTWYIDLRKYGSVPHAGFGLGLERFVGWVCGTHHIREVVPFPRMYGRLFP
jgi:asparaginyl-tRNA synthetase